MKIGISSGWHPSKNWHDADMVVRVKRKTGQRWLRSYKQWRTCRAEIKEAYGVGPTLSSVKRQRTDSCLHRMQQVRPIMGGSYVIKSDLFEEILRELAK